MTYRNLPSLNYLHFPSRTKNCHPILGFSNSGVFISNLGPFGWKAQKETKFPLVTNVVAEQIGMKPLGSLGKGDAFRGEEGSCCVFFGDVHVMFIWLRHCVFSHVVCFFSWGKKQSSCARNMNGMCWDIKHTQTLRIFRVLFFSWSNSPGTRGTHHLFRAQVEGGKWVSWYETS